MNEPWSKKVSSLFYKSEFGKVFPNNEKTKITDYLQEKERSLPEV